MWTQMEQNKPVNRVCPSIKYSSRDKLAETIAILLALTSNDWFSLKQWKSDKRFIE